MTEETEGGAPPAMQGINNSRRRVIVFGNEKGGSGKSTTAMHLVVHLLQLGHKVASLDLDVRQGSLSRFVENRRAHIAARGLRLPVPHHVRLPRSVATRREDAEAEEIGRMVDVLPGLIAHNDYLVIDTPGHDSALSRLGHSFADILVTPLNDSFVDLDVLAAVDPDSFEIARLSQYSELVWEIRKLRAQRDRGEIDWVVMRTRLSNLTAHNKTRMSEALETLSSRIGFRLADGFGERVIFRELFPRGLTVLDLADGGADVSLSLSHIAARQEVRALVDALGLSARAIDDERATGVAPKLAASPSEPVKASA